jgi:hypothetical protein
MKRARMENDRFVSLFVFVQVACREWVILCMALERIRARCYVEVNIVMMTMNVLSVAGPCLGSVRT